MVMQEQLSSSLCQTIEMINLWFLSCLHSNSFLSVVVITCALHAQGRRFEPGRKQDFCCCLCSFSLQFIWCEIYDVVRLLLFRCFATSENVISFLCIDIWFYGVMVSTQDSESCDPSSSLGRT